MQNLPCAATQTPVFHVLCSAALTALYDMGTCSQFSLLRSRVNTKTMWLVLVLFLMAGCASRPVWVQEGKTDTQTERDFNDCHTQAKQKFGTNLESPLFTTAVNQCMESRGYNQIRLQDRMPKSTVAPVPPG